MLEILLFGYIEKSFMVKAIWKHSQYVLKQQANLP